ncbi:hypothetical protein P171DRAFT_446159 [Karstenula rhodostoma CBS 690.94]|uniref:Uncharacterized protein n=1 Tax=Karstenula rhodostoma CBS 690.94 TaxID=1392251 RepID=A0A9P4UAW2_9PLEO|nr:hypothetical protein P171DRAFT_446159 [Karstenula rhodostoma CBS 690.94]
MSILGGSAGIRGLRMQGPHGGVPSALALRKDNMVDISFGAAQDGYDSRSGARYASGLRREDSQCRRRRPRVASRPYYTWKCNMRRTETIQEGGFTIGGPTYNGSEGLQGGRTVAGLSHSRRCNDDGGEGRFRAASVATGGVRFITPRMHPLAYTPGEGEGHGSCLTGVGVEEREMHNDEGLYRRNGWARSASELACCAHPMADQQEKREAPSPPPAEMGGMPVTTFATFGQQCQQATDTLEPARTRSDRENRRTWAPPSSTVGVVTDGKEFESTAGVVPLPMSAGRVPTDSASTLGRAESVQLECGAKPDWSGMEFFARAGTATAFRSARALAQAPYWVQDTMARDQA